MKFGEFIQALHGCGWKSIKTVDRTKIHELWKKIFPVYVVISELEKKNEDLKNELRNLDFMIGEK